MSILESANSENALRTWQDDDDGKLETYVTEIAIELVLAAEIRYRERAIHQYGWRVERKAQLEAIRLAQSRNRTSSSEEFERWSQWALAQADRIDPAIGGTFLMAMQDEDDTP